jgi:hypothetical protein
MAASAAAPGAVGWRASEPESAQGDAGGGSSGCGGGGCGGGGGFGGFGGFGGGLDEAEEEEAEAEAEADDDLRQALEFMEQRGVLRTNCVDCLDRTNVAQFSVAMRAMGLQLYCMGKTKAPALEIGSKPVGLPAHMACSWMMRLTFCNLQFGLTYLPCCHCR